MVFLLLFTNIVIPLIYFITPFIPLNSLSVPLVIPLVISNINYLWLIICVDNIDFIPIIFLILIPIITLLFFLLTITFLIILFSHFYCLHWLLIHLFLFLPLFLFLSLVFMYLFVLLYILELIGIIFLFV